MTKLVQEGNMKKYLKYLTLVIIHISISANIGNIMLTKGEVIILRGQKTITPKKLEIIRSGDTIETQKNAIAIVKLTDKTVIKISELTKIQVKELLTGNSPTTLELKEGSSFFQVERSLSNTQNKLLIKTRTASLGVRGTTFFAAVSNTKNSSDTWMCVKEGEVVASSLNTRESKVVKTGEGIKISAEDKLQEPRFLPWTKGLNWELNYENSDNEIENKLNIREAYEDILNTDYE